MRHARAVADGGDLGTETEISPRPSSEVLFGGEHRPLCKVTASMGEYKVVAEVNWITRPGNEVVDVAPAG